VTTGQSVVIHDVHISNPTRVWHELKNSRLKFGPKGETWLSGGWNSGNSQCLANMLRYVSRAGAEDTPDDYGHTLAQSEAERLVTKLVSHKGWESIPGFNDSKSPGPEGFKAISEVLDEAAALVKPYAFTHSVTIASEIMTKQEKDEMNRAVWSEFLRKDARKLKDKVSEKVQDFVDWLDSYEDRGWDTFWDELAECDTPECEEMKKEFINS
jgi:hypothetical protein